MNANHKLIKIVQDWITNSSLQCTDCLDMAGYFYLIKDAPMGFCTRHKQCVSVMKADLSDVRPLTREEFMVARIMQS